MYPDPKYHTAVSVQTVAQDIPGRDHYGHIELTIVRREGGNNSSTFTAYLTVAQAAALASMSRRAITAMLREQDIVADVAR